MPHSMEGPRAPSSQEGMDNGASDEFPVKRGLLHHLAGGLLRLRSRFSDCAHIWEARSQQGLQSLHDLSEAEVTERAGVPESDRPESKVACGNGAERSSTRLRADVWKLQRAIP